MVKNDDPQLATTTVAKKDLVALYRKALASGAPLEHLEKKMARLLQRTEVTVVVEELEDKHRRSALRQQISWPVRFISTAVPVSLVAVGVFLVGSAIVPIALSYVLTSTPLLSTQTLAAPVPQADVLDFVPTVVADRDGSIAQAVASNPDGPVIIDAELDYTNLSNWFDTIEVPGAVADATTYILDIPEVGIEQAEVKLGGTNLDNSLIQYPGTADPGQVGAPVIFGHSVLRQFYNPDLDNPRRYNSIFSYIMTLDPGDDIFITHEGIKYQYKVRTKTEVKPEDTYILAQRNDSRLLKLVTCTPEGTYLRRGVVTAELVN